MRGGTSYLVIALMLAATAALLAPLACHAAEGEFSVQQLPNGDFRGQGRIEAHLETPTIVHLGPLAGSQEFALLTFTAKALAGTPTLLVAPSRAAAAETAPEPPWWNWLPPTDGRGHRVELTLATPPGDQVCLGLAPGSGKVQIDDLRLTPLLREPTYDDPWLSGLKPATFPEPLPAGWVPEGTLDAKPRQIGGTTELVLNVGGLTITLPAETTALRGYRHGVLVYLDNRGEVDKSVTISVQSAEPGGGMPTYTLPARARGTTGWLAPFQAMRAGERVVKYTFAVGKESASAPVTFHVQAAYPALGSAPGGRGERPWDPSAWIALPSQYLVGPPEALPVLPDQLLEIPWPEERAVAGLRSAILRQYPELARITFPAGADAVGGIAAAYQMLKEQVLPSSPNTAAVSPTWPLLPTEQGLQPSPPMKEAFEQGLGEWVESVAVGVTALPRGGVLLERLDGKVPSGPQTFWREFSRWYSFAALRAWLREKQAAHPVLLDLTGMPANGAPRLEMLLLARLLIDQTWQGSTGVIFGADGGLLAQADGKPRSPVYEAVQELWRELAAAAPINVPVGEDGLCATSPEAPVRCWAFLRGREGILFLANNTSAPQDLAVELRLDPVQMQVLRLRAFGPPVAREIQDLFRYSEEAKKRRQPAVYLRLAPGEVVGLSLRLAVSDWTWLRSVGRMAPRAEPLPGPPPPLGDRPAF